MTRAELAADCGRCAALCCIAHPFDASDDFAISKDANARCPHLTQEHRCRIHDQLADAGFPGCVIYTCYGAGQRVTARALGVSAYEVFRVTRALHELMWLLSEALRLRASEGVAGELRAMIERLDLLCATTEIVDVDAERRTTHALLRRIGRLIVVD